jgi:glycosyltransferase involved in cell wall biosynthesis
MRNELGFSADDIVVGKIARLFELKGHEFIVQAAPSVVAQCPNVRFLFVGDGVLRETLEATIARMGLQRHFVFAGLVAPAEVPKYIGAMDMLVHTSLREGLARALPQGLLSGIPAISYDIDGAREVVRSGETGYLLKPKSIAPLADAIVKLADDPEARMAMGQAGRAWCQTRFDHRHMTHQIRSLYMQLLEENANPTSRD